MENTKEYHLRFYSRKKPGIIKFKTLKPLQKYMMESKYFDELISVHEYCKESKELKEITNQLITNKGKAK